MEGLSLDSSFSISSLIAGFIFGIIGLWIFNRGRKAPSVRFAIIGLLLMLYPYFVSGALLTWGVGLALCGYSYYTWDI